MNGYGRSPSYREGQVEIVDYSLPDSDVHSHDSLSASNPCSPEPSSSDDSIESVYVYN